MKEVSSLQRIEMNDRRSRYVNWTWFSEVVRHMIGKRIRHIQRYQEITNAFIRNGFTYFIKDLGLLEMFASRRKWTSEKQTIQQRTLGERVRNFLEELGPSFIKLGQLASTRPDLFPVEVVRELEKLQDSVPPFAYSDVERIIEEELGHKITELFLQFEQKPLAAASIGQVHQAVLKNNQSVAIKIQRPNIREIIETDLEIIADLARLAESRFDWAAKHQVCDLVHELGESLRKELDYENEARNAEKLARNFSDDETLFVPNIYWDFTTKKVLTLDFVDGVKINDLDRLAKLPFDRKEIAERFANVLLKQILIDGFFHGDPHPGNVIILQDGQIGMIDFGLMGKLNPHMKYQFASLVIAMRRQSTDGVIRAISQMELIPIDADMMQLRSDIDDLREKYYRLSLSDIRLGEALNDLFTIAYNHHIQFPSDFTLLGKSILTMEGIIEQLDPDLNIMKLADPFGKRLIKERYDPKNIASRIWSNTAEVAEEMIKFPKNLRELIIFLKKGKLRHEATIPQLDVFLRKIDKIGNRLSYSIVLLSFSIIMVGLIIGTSIGHESTFFWRLPVVEIGFIIATFMVIWLLYSIFRSGRWY